MVKIVHGDNVKDDNDDNNNDSVIWNLILIATMMKFLMITMLMILVTILMDYNDIHVAFDNDSDGNDDAFNAR